MVRLLAVSDEVEPWALVVATAQPGVDLVVSSGDLPFDYLAGIVDRIDRPGVLVPGNHDPDVDGAPPPGWVDADGLVVDVGGLRIAGWAAACATAMAPTSGPSASRPAGPAVWCAGRGGSRGATAAASTSC
jgi:hypothetical protein